MNPAEGQMNTKSKIKTKKPYNKEAESPGNLHTSIFRRISLDIGNLKRQIQHSHAE